MSILKDTIPIFRTFISKTAKIASNDIINANSLFKSDLSKISIDGTKLLSRRPDDGVFIIFSIDLSSIITSEQIQSIVNTIYESTFTIEAYGDDSQETILDIRSGMLSRDGVNYFSKNKIGLSPLIEINSSYEELNGVQWLRTIATIKFSYEKIVIVPNEEIYEIGKFNNTIIRKEI